MGFGSLQTHTAHFTEYSEGLLNILQMTHKETCRTIDKFIQYPSSWNMTKTSGLMQDVVLPT